MDSAAQNVAVVRAIHAAANARDAERVTELLAPDFELDYSRSRSPLAGVFRGRDVVIEAAARMAEAWDYVQWRAEKFEPFGADQVLVHNRAVMRGAGSGIDIEARGIQVWSLRDGVATRMCMYQQLADVPGATDSRR